MRPGQCFPLLRHFRIQVLAESGSLSLLVPPGRGVDAAGAGGRRAAPDALVRAGPVAVLARRRVDAPRPVGRRAAPFAVLLVVAMLVLPRRRMDASAPIARRSAMPAFRAHRLVPSGFRGALYHFAASAISGACRFRRTASFTMAPFRAMSFRKMQRLSPGCR